MRKYRLLHFIFTAVILMCPCQVVRASACLKELQKSGVVRIDGALTAETADALRDFVDAERLRAEAEVASGAREFTDRFVMGWTEKTEKKGEAVQCSCGLFIWGLVMYSCNLYLKVLLM